MGLGIFYCHEKNKGWTVWSIVASTISPLYISWYQFNHLDMKQRRIDN